VTVVAHGMLSAKMTTKPKPKKRPTDVVSNAVHVMKVLTGQVEDTPVAPEKNAAAVELGSKGGMARAASLSKKKRAEIARKAAEKRWGK